MVHAFLANTGIRGRGNLLFDEMDYHHGVMDVVRIQETISELIQDVFT